MVQQDQVTHLQGRLHRLVQYFDQTAFARVDVVVHQPVMEEGEMSQHWFGTSSESSIMRVTLLRRGNYLESGCGHGSQLLHRVGNIRQPGQIVKRNIEYNGSFDQSAELKIGTPALDSRDHCLVVAAT